jgi:hypothetical protein
MAHEYFEDLLPAMTINGAAALAAAALDAAGLQQRADAAMDCEGAQRVALHYMLDTTRSGNPDQQLTGGS